ncbi:hypothetical protein ACHHYP_13106 [Achlya hypogyna]|uniref:Uncharacterized protein n=1 Tax=Achlya hypogyna TaxID=1202772 RepID=A0A1V9YFT3_ACHHY|nr:hypothetical protein ACHHYP_13106 [Achlya hypogyna]
MISADVDALTTFADGPADDDASSSDDESRASDEVPRQEVPSPQSARRHSVASIALPTVTVHAMQLPNKAQQRRRQQRLRNKRNAAQVQRIMGWYPTERLENMQLADQAQVACLRDSIQHTKSSELLRLMARLHGTPESDADLDVDEDENNDGVRDPPESTDTTPLYVADDKLRELALTAGELERQVTALERAYRGEAVYSSASTVQFSLPSTGAFTFSPSTAPPPSCSTGMSALHTGDAPAMHRVFSKSLVSLYEEVDAISVPEDDRSERHQFLDNYRLAARGHASAQCLQATYRMHRCRRKYLAWRRWRRWHQAKVLHAWVHVLRVEGFARRNSCRRVFREWADEVECTIKLRLIELKLLQQSSTRVATISNIVKNLFLTTVDEKASGVYQRPTVNYGYQFVNQAYASVQDRSNDLATVSRIAEIRAAMRKARDVVAKQFVHTVFLRWKAYQEAHRRTAVNAQLCLRRAMRLAFLRRPTWLGERVQVVFEMWARFAVFCKHKRQCMDVPRFATPLAQWDVWLREYKERQLRKLAAQARGPLMWMLRYFRLLHSYVVLSRAKKAENRRARAYCSRRQLALVFAKWYGLTQVNLETRGAMKKAFSAWQTYTAMRSDCRVPKRKMQIRTRDGRVHKAWEGWKEAKSRRSVLHLDRLARLLQPSMYARAVHALYHWAGLDSQELKWHLFRRWQSQWRRRRAFAKLWCAGTTFSERILLQVTFAAWHRQHQGTPTNDLVLAPDIIATQTLMEHTLPFAFDTGTDDGAGVVLSELHGFHAVVRDGNLHEMEALLLEDPRLAVAREPVLGNSALHIAVQARPKRQGREEYRRILLLLLRQGASPFVVNGRGESALALTPDLEDRYFLQTNGYGFHEGNAPTRINLDTIDTRLIWQTLLRLAAELQRGDRAIGDPDLGGWHSFLRVTVPPAKWTEERRRQPFLYIMANKLLQRTRVTAATTNAPAVLRHLHGSHHRRLLSDRARVPDACTFECFTDAVLEHDTTLMIIPAFHAEYYYGKDVCLALEHTLRTELLPPLLQNRPPLERTEAEVERLSGLCRTAEAQLVLVERSNASALPPSDAKCYGSTAEELAAVDMEMLEIILRIYFKLQQVRMVDKANEKQSTFVALQSVLPAETALLQRIERAIDDESRLYNKMLSTLAAATKKLGLYQDAYTSLLAAYRQASPHDTTDHGYGKLVAVRMQVDEAHIAVVAAERKRRKKDASQHRLQTLHTIYRDLLNEQRTWTKDEFTILDAHLSIAAASLEGLAVTHAVVDGRRRALLDEMTQRRGDDRLSRRNVKTTAKKLLLQLHVLHQTHSALAVLLVIPEVDSAPRPLAHAASAATADEEEAPVTVSPMVAQALQKQLVKRSPVRNGSLAESVLVQAYKRSLVLLFEEERRIIAEEVERQRAEEVKHQEVFHEANPVANSHRTSATRDVDRLDHVRRETRVAITPPTRRRPKAETRPNSKRLELQKARISMLSRAASLDAASPRDVDEAEPLEAALFVGQPRTIEGMQYTFANFASRAFWDGGPVPPEPQAVQLGPTENDVDEIWRSHGQVASLSATTLALKARVFESQTALKPVEATSPPPLQRTNSRAGRRHTLVTQMSQGRFKELSEARSRDVASREKPDDTVEEELPNEPMEVQLTAVVKATVTLEVLPTTPAAETLALSATPPTPQPQDENDEVFQPPASTEESMEAPESAPHTPLLLRIGMPPLTPPPPRESVSSQLGITSSDLLANLESYALFSQALLQQQPAPPNRRQIEPGISQSSPALLPAASSDSPSHERQMRLFDDLMKCDETLIRTAKRNPKRRRQPKRTIPRHLPALETSFSLDGKAFAALQAPAEVTWSLVPPRVIPAPARAPSPSPRDANPGIDGEVEEDEDERRLRLARIELQFNPQNDPARKPPAAESVKYSIKTRREDRPFLAPPAPAPMQPPALANVVLCGSHVPPPTVASKPLFACIPEAVVQRETMSAEEKTRAWDAFSSKPLPPVVQAAYAELFPGTYLTTTALRRDAVLAPSQSSGGLPIVPSVALHDRSGTRRILGRKSVEVSFWQAIEGFKSIRDETIHGLLLPPAKDRRKRRGIEVVAEYLSPSSSQALPWLFLEYPDLIDSAERAVQCADVPATAFDALQRVVEARLAQSNVKSDG